MNVIFMSSSEFGVPALQALLASDIHNVSAVFTSQAKPKGRGLNISASEIQLLSEKYGIPVYTPNSLKTLEAQNLITSINADVIIVVSYGLIIPDEILVAKKYGAINIHPSLLPKYRGAAPLQHTILNGDTKTGVCIIQMDSGIDTGDIILQEQFAIPPNVTFSELHDKCAKVGADLLLQVLQDVDSIARKKQDLIGSSYAKKFTKESGRIDWNSSANHIDCMVRAMNPWPGVYFYYQDRIIKVLESEYSNDQYSLPNGTTVNNHLGIKCGNGIFVIKRLQLEGKKAMNTQDFLRGTPIPAGTLLS